MYTTSAAQAVAAEVALKAYDAKLRATGYGAITTELREASEFYCAEDYHQQYRAKNPGGYCALGGTSVSCPDGVGA